jgi:hypothetical protein
LKRAGATHVTLLALARTDRRELLSYQPDAASASLDSPASSAAAVGSLSGGVIVGSSDFGSSD